MKNIETIAIPVILLLFCCTACRDNAIEIDSMEKETFLNQNREGIYRNGNPLFVFNASRHQKASNSARLQYRMQTDEQDTCLNITLEAIPKSSGVHITTSIDYRSPGELISSMNHLECSKVQKNRLWLWNPDNLTGIIMDIQN